MDRGPFSMNASRQAAGAFIFIAVVFLAGIYTGIHQSITQAQTPGPESASSSSAGSVTITLSGTSGQPSNVDFSQFWDAWNLLEQNFVEAHATGTIPSDQEKVYGAIEGLVNSYGDPYTTFFPPSDAAVFDQDINGSFGGVGMEIGTDQSGQLVVIAPLKGSPAEAAGIKAGDKILYIDATSTAGMSADEAVTDIRGQNGTTVKITVSRESVPQPIVIPIVRSTIQIPDISYSNNAGTGIFEIDLYSFSATSDADFRTALRAFLQSGDTKLLLDLRGNPGGYLDSAVDMASFFLPEGDVVVTEDYEGRQANIVHRSFGYNVFANKKLSMAILVDQDTASAAEILSGALQQHGVAVLVGTRTFGKGSVQELFDLGGGAQLKITVARWLTPNGTSISDGGLTPDINATTTTADVEAGNDPQKTTAIQYLETH
ncbi:MAG: S41 family peptidase [Patescibacteria group bacterium]|nr:S41 family peptidase [Patescibacteria group bacterium]